MAFYAQLIGEDSSNTGIPSATSGSSVLRGGCSCATAVRIRGFFEYAGTSCPYYAPSSRPNCAYRQSIFVAGYRFHGRSIGHTIDSDSDLLSVGVDLIESSGTTWSIRARKARLDRFGGVDIFNPLTQAEHVTMPPSFGGQARCGTGRERPVGVERQRFPAQSADLGGFGFVTWRKQLN